MNRYLSLRDIWRVALFTLAYLAAYKYGSLFPQHASAPLWFPDSVLLCALLLTPKKKWWLYLIAAAPIRFVPGFCPAVPVWFLWATLINDAAKAILSASLLRHFAGDPIRLNTVRKLTTYLGIAVLMVPILSAFGGAASRRALGYDFWPAWSQWFLGNALTNLAITPTLLLWFSGGYRQLRGRGSELTLWISSFVICLRVTVLLARSSDPPLALYAPLPFLIWAAARLGTTVASTALSAMAVFLMQVITGIYTSLPAIMGEQDVHFVQLFLGTVCFPVLFVAVLIEERQSIEHRLRDSQEELNRNYERATDLAGRLIGAQEEERKRIARELHDDVSQRLAVLMWGLDGLTGELRTNVALSQQISRLRIEAVGIAEIVRDLSHELHSATLRHLGIVRGLEGLCDGVSQQHNVQVDLEIEQAQDLPDDVSLCLFRVAQEALNNAVRHGKAARVSVKLFRRDDLLCLEVRDAGVGFDPEVTSGGLGLVSMRERLRIVGGTLLLHSSPGQGTVIEAAVNCAPLKRQQQAAS